jgi:rhamnosyltransferase
MKKNKLSVIIRTKNEEQFIGACLQSILDNLFKPEIIIIDNNSTDKTLEIIRYFIQDPYLKNETAKNYTKIKIFNIDDYTPGRSLNLGVKNATQDNILIMSAHCELNKINIDKHIDELNKYICIFGNQIPVFFGKKITKRYIWSNFGSKKKENYFSNFENRYFIHNALCMYKKKLLLKNPFDEKLQGKEDRYWINNMMKKKIKFLYDPSLEAKHNYTLAGNTWKGIG